MKRSELIKQLELIARQQGKLLTITHGGKHDKAYIGNKFQPIPRHKEINEIVAKKIIKHMAGETHEND